MIDLVVTRHAALVEYLRELGLVGPQTEVKSHATIDMVQGRHVCGVLPHSLSVQCASFTEVPLSLPAELRGQELSLDQVRRHAAQPTTYLVRHANPNRVSDRLKQEAADRVTKFPAFACAYCGGQGYLTQPSGDEYLCPDCQGHGIY